MKTIPLKGMRIVVSGFELEQAEHRGIAVFSKGLLRTLKKLGTEDVHRNQEFLRHKSLLQ